MKKLLNKVFEYGLYVIVFLLPWQTRYIFRQPELNGQPWPFGEISLYGLEILLGVLFILGIIRYISHAPRLEFRYNKYVLEIVSIVLLFLVFVFLSIYFAGDRALALDRSIKLLEGVVLFLLIIYAKFSFRKICESFVAATLIQSVLAIIQFITQGFISLKWLGLSDHVGGRLGEIVVETTSGRWIRAYGSFDHPNILGAFLVVGLLFIVYLFLRAQTKKQHLILSAIAVFHFAALFTTFSRSAFFALLIGYAIVAVFFIAIIDQWGKRVIAQLALIGFLTMSVMGVFYFDLVVARTQLSHTASVGERLTQIEVSREVLKEHWHTGVGMGNYTLASMDKADLMPYEQSQPIHNVFIMVLLEVGVFGFLLFLSLLYHIGKIIYIYRVEYSGELITIFKEYDKIDTFDDYQKSAYWYVVFTSVLIALFILFFFDHYFWTLLSPMLLLWLSLGLWLRQAVLKKV